MFDETSLVSYSSNKEVEYRYYRDFTWNSKRWRQMVYVSKENSAIAFSRQYPYTDENFSVEVRKMLEDKFSEYFKLDNVWKINDNSQKYIDVYDDTNLLYNDIRHGYEYKTIINKFDSDKNQKRVYIGVEVAKFSDEAEYLEEGDSCLW